MTENSNTPNDLNNPNDKFFKGALGMIDIARPFLIEVLPKDLLEKLDLNTLFCCIFDSDFRDDSPRNY